MTSWSDITDGDIWRNVPPISAIDVRVADEDQLVTLQQRTDALCRGLDLVLAHHGAPGPIREQLRVQLCSYFGTSESEMVWLARCKHLLTYPLAKYLRNDSPTPPDLPFKPCGSLRGWMRARLNAFCRRNTHLWYSWFQAKRSTLPLSEDVIEETYTKHFATLSKEDEGDDEVIEEIFADETFRGVLDETRKKMTSILKTIDSFDSLSASSSACFEQTRGKGGQNAELLRLSGVTEITSAQHDLVRMGWSPVGISGGCRHLNAVFELRSPIHATTQWKSLKSLVAEWDRSKPLNCTIQAVLEPNKVRVISKGNALAYYSCRPLQKALHGAMRDMPCFRLIGRPFSPDDMLDLAAKAQSSFDWFSVDYSAATDGLSWKFSGRIFRHLIGNLPEEDRLMALAVLGPHRLYYPPRGGGKPVFRGLQRNGQLMGSILSFPILCLANLGVYLRNTARLQANWSHAERLNHVLINGDDMVYAAPRDLWKSHVEIGEAVGLKMSVGKAYCHPVYANVNSTSVHHDLRALRQREVFPILAYGEDGSPREVREFKSEPTPWQINYLNAGLFFGQHKVQSSDRVANEHADEDDLLIRYGARRARALAAAHLGQDPSLGLVPNLNLVLSGSLPGRQIPLLKRWLSCNAEASREECSITCVRKGKVRVMTRNLFLPLSVGGMGVLPPVGWKYSITPDDRHLARGMAMSHPGLYTWSRPLPGYEIGDVDELVDCPYLKPIKDVGEIPNGKTSMTKLATRRCVTGISPYSSTSAVVFYNRPRESSRVGPREVHRGFVRAILDLFLGE